jgi:Ni,Fe-hydrogenase III large subunit/Ni,Fe-hydrogenase III component G
MKQTTRFPLPGIALAPVPGALPAWHGEVTAEQLVDLCQAVRDTGGRMISLWGTDERDRDGGFALFVALQDRDGLLIAQLPLDAAHPQHPDLSTIFPVANRLQRANYDLTGIRAVGGDARWWLRHGNWPSPAFPLRREINVSEDAVVGDAEYRFVRVEGDGVHEIAVGPVHAGIIEPGHFRFSVVGEKLLRLEERLGYVHKGIEKRFESMTLADGVRLAARVSGDSAVAFAWAYAMAVEGLTATMVPERASWLRALYLERERIANHLGDLGALGNDAGFAFGLSQFLRLKENLLRANSAAFGQRYLMDVIVPGGARVDLSPESLSALLASLAPLEAELHTLREIYDNHSGLQDRFMGAGRVTRSLAEQLGVIGLTARASGLRQDWRHEMPVDPYHLLNIEPAVQAQGDVAARVAVRFEELTESLRLCRALLESPTMGPVDAPLGPIQVDGIGIGGIEGWRGPVFVAISAEADGRIRRCHPHDPSWQNWPVLEHAVIDNIVPDFPLINKSFNLSYSGHDL